jgi:pentatricopeptide repeat protein
VPHRKQQRLKSKPAVIDETQIEATIASLPARFTPADLSSLLSGEPNPLLCLHILSWFTHHPRFRPDPNPFLVTIKRLGSARLFVEMDSVASLALSMPSLPVSSSLYNTLIYFYLEAGRLGKAFHVYTVMFKSKDPSAKPTTHTYNLLFTALLNRCSRNSYIQYVYMDNIRALFRQMIELEIKPDLLCLNSLIKGYVQSMHLNDALRIFHQMGHIYGLEPDGCTYSYLIHGLCAQGRTRNAQELFDEMKAKKLVLDTRASNSIVSALAIKGEVEDATIIMWELGAMGRVMDGITCRALISEMGRLGRCKDAKELVWKMAEKGVIDPKLRRELLMWIEDEFSDNYSRSEASNED